MVISDITSSTSLLVSSGFYEELIDKIRERNYTGQSERDRYKCMGRARSRTCDVTHDTGPGRLLNRLTHEIPQNVH